MNRHLQVLAFAAVLLTIGGCEDKKAREALESAKRVSANAHVKLSDLTAKGKAAVVQVAQDQAADLDQIIIDFKQRAATSSGDAKVKLEEDVRALEANRISLKQKLDALLTDGREEWKTLAQEFDGIVAQMRRTIADIRAKMK